MPASPAPAASSCERRSSARCSVVQSLVVPVQIGQDNGGVVLNLGNGGIAVQAVQNLVPGTSVSIRMHLPRRAEPLLATAEVAWSNAQKVAGLRLRDVDAAHAEPLRELWERLALKRPPTRVVLAPVRMNSSAAAAPAPAADPITVAAPRVLPATLTMPARRRWPLELAAPAQFASPAPQLAARESNWKLALAAAAGLTLLALVGIVFGGHPKRHASSPLTTPVVAAAPRVQPAAFTADGAGPTAPAQAEAGYSPLEPTPEAEPTASKPRPAAQRKPAGKPRRREIQKRSAEDEGDDQVIVRHFMTWPPPRRTQ